MGKKRGGGIKKEKQNKIKYFKKSPHPTLSLFLFPQYIFFINIHHYDNAKGK